jgi:hypothetical protein
MNVENTEGGTGGKAQVVECLPSKHKSLNSDSSTAKNQKPEGTMPSDPSSANIHGEGWVWWLTSIIHTTQKAEIRKK